MKFHPQKDAQILHKLVHFSLARLEELAKVQVPFLVFATSHFSPNEIQDRALQYQKSSFPEHYCKTVI